MSSNITPTDKLATQSTITTNPNPITQMLNAPAKADSAIEKAKAMPGTDSFLKNLFQTVQGVKHDALCPHGLPYYACMSCSH